MLLQFRSKEVMLEISTNPEISFIRGTSVQSWVHPLAQLCCLIVGPELGILSAPIQG